MNPIDEGAPHPGNGTMLAFAPGSKEAVDALYAKAIELGTTCEGEPGQRLNQTGQLSDNELRQYALALQQLTQSTAVLLALAREESVEQEPLGLLGEIEHRADRGHTVFQQCLAQ